MRRTGRRRDITGLMSDRAIDRASAAPPSKHVATEHKVHVGFAVALLCMAAIAIIAHRTVGQLREDTGWIEHTHQVLEQIEVLDSAVTESQNQLRGFALTGEPAHLAEFAPLTAAIKSSVETLRRLTGDNPEQRQRLAGETTILDAFLGFAQQVIDARRLHGFDAARALILSKQGDSFRHASSDTLRIMRGTEYRLLTTRQQRLHRSATETDAVIIGGSLFAVFFVAVAVIAIQRDLVGRRRAEEALRRSEEELDRFFTLSLDFLTIAGADGYFKRVSGGVTDILGWTPAEFIAQPYLDLVHPEDRAATEVEARRQIEGGEKVMRFENRYRHKDGSWRVLSWRSVPAGDGLMYGAARDVTEWKRVDDEIRRLNRGLREHAEQLELSNKELEAFSYSVSHDLRAPLRHIEGYLEMLQHELGPGLSGDAARFVTTISASARKMNALIDELLSFSKMGRQAMLSEDLELGPIVADVRRELELVTRDRNIVWKIGVLPRVKGDRAMVRQVLANLLGNAVKYTRPRHPAEISIAAAGEENDRAIIVVRDNGVGFDMKYAEKLFGVFQRLHREKDFEGTGIGLANVQRIIARHRGRVWAEAKLDAGAAFYFTLEKSE